MAAINLPRLSSAAPIVQQNDTAAQQFVGQWNALCNAIETNVNALAAQQTQIDAVLGIANGATTDAALAQALANYLSHLTQQPIASGQVVANATGSAAVPTGTALSALMDLVLGASQGDVLYRGAAEWGALAAGTSGQVLTTAGAAANPAWAPAGGSGFIGTYHDETSSRSISTVYTNTQTVAIFINIKIYGQVSGNVEVYLSINGTIEQEFTAFGGPSAVTLIGWANPGDTYELTSTGSPSIQFWSERY